MSEQKTYYYALDGVRFAAALSVAVFHLGFYAWASDTSTTAHMFDHSARLSLLAPFTWFGWVGVETFFVISGFVIANSANGATPAGFAKSRMLRLLPAAWICATFTLFALVLIAHDPVRALLAPYLHALTLWPAAPWIDGVYWSLAVEVSFYAAIFLLLLVGRFSVLPLFTWALALASAAFLSFAWAHRLGYLADDRLWTFVTQRAEVLLLRHGVYFALGIWMWMATRSAMTPLRWAGVALCTFAAMAEIALRLSAIRAEEAPVAPPFALVPIAVWLISVVALFAFTQRPEQFAPSGPRARATLRWVGQATYPLYLIHNVLGAGVMRLAIGAGANAYLAFALALACGVGLAFFVAALMEPAVRNLLRAVLEWVEARLRPLPVLSRLFRPTERVLQTGLAKTHSD